ncbi:hypothetical protein CEUSTIGMA_g2300.t1 [Chlamydomonas eustigma]|uniref:Ribulose bisphosphate carboxylase/oxygenase activase, chloroplastic n=1 Tax=Chlamydomonas eustigma TaxID=1157962 RepID=A0A250WVI8_9CHLO|nr:hypothetical protein CEUSTIGMA_g2300.t1 [Chlamydomonas eustigma]|eukprot:GAX74854.1 hypothetical protein CEUSTIGMA_g2300.t1 [Chlamydomonas eustigma]
MQFLRLHYIQQSTGFNKKTCIPTTPSTPGLARCAQKDTVQEAASSSGRKYQSSWGAREAGNDKDYLHNLGAAQNYNINIETGQTLAMGLDFHITGNFLGHKSDIADGSLRKYEFRTFSNIIGDYYVAPRFLEKIALHFAKNYLSELGHISNKIKIPLVLGIWGPKGMGKTFQTELAMKQLGVQAVVMSAGELEHEWAGTPARLIRERYRKAADMSKVRGVMTCLMINDIDAGLAHFENTQVTVNNQMVIGTLMNICDDPKRVSIGQDWIEQDVIRRTPIVVTGNDFSKMFAPLIRDGRMEKFYWEPERIELEGIVWQMYKEDGVSMSDVSKLLERFKRQPLDFFGALRASTYDDQIRDWIKLEITGENSISDTPALKKLGRRLVDKVDLPKFEPVSLTLDMLIEQGERLEHEQTLVMTHNLAREYMKFGQATGGLIGLQG